MENLIQQGLIESDPEKMGGTPVFSGTRVPIKNLFDYLEGGENIDEFLEDFPTVEPNQVERFKSQIRLRGLRD